MKCHDTTLAFEMLKQFLTTLIDVFVDYLRYDEVGLDSADLIRLSSVVLQCGNSIRNVFFALQQIGKSPQEICYGIISFF